MILRLLTGTTWAQGSVVSTGQQMLHYPSEDPTMLRFAVKPSPEHRSLGEDGGDFFQRMIFMINLPLFPS